jgi:outer membrane protein assembly factor BamD (BamD/ComL family)
MNLLLRALLLLVAALASGCSLTRPLLALDEEPLAPMPGSDLASAEIDRQLEIGANELEQGLVWEAARRSLELIEDSRLDSDQGNTATQILIDAFGRGIEQSTRSRQLERFRPSRLPRAVRAMQGVGKARLLLAEGEPYSAYDEIRKLEDRFPAHHLTREAADVVYRAGTELYHSTGRYLLFFTDRGRSPQVLEYLVLRHPTHPGCDECYWLLAQYAEDARDFDRAITSLEDLVLFHPSSPHAVEAEARIPMLRLEDHVRVDFDTSLVKRARTETELWLQRHGARTGDAAHDALVERMEALLVDCLTRWSRADLVVARYYDKLGEGFGARMHADRARRLAEQAGLTAEVEEALAIAARHPSPVAGPLLQEAPPQ